MKIKFIEDKKQNLVTIIVNCEIKLSFNSRDFYKICNSCSGTFTTRHPKEQWILTAIRKLDGNSITLTRGNKHVMFKTVQVPKNIKI